MKKMIILAALTLGTLAGAQSAPSAKFRTQELALAALVNVLAERELGYKCTTTKVREFPNKVAANKYYNSYSPIPWDFGSVEKGMFGWVIKSTKTIFIVNIVPDAKVKRTFSTECTIRI